MSTDTILQSHEKRPFPITAAAYDAGQTDPAKGVPRTHRREPASEAAINYPQQIPPTITKLEYAGTHTAWALVLIHQTQTNRSGSHQPSTIYLNPISLCSGKAQG
jgi:hypothetical protein